jgi:hypothetical protein
LPFDKRQEHPRAPTHPARRDTATDYAPYRWRYRAKQQAMEASIGPLRGRLRATLAARSPALARLAAVDAVMEHALGARERSLLSTVPVLLQKHFERLRQADRATLGDTQAPGESDNGVPPGGWLDLFCQDMHGVLLAELDIRLQPVEGLLEALRTK